MNCKKLDEMSWQELAAEHSLAKAELAVVKAREMTLRKHICNAILQGKQKGVVHRIEDGFDFAATAKVNTNLDKELLENIMPELSDAEKDCIKYTPSIVAKPYGSLDSQSKLHLAVTVKPGAPTLTIKPVK